MVIRTKITKESMFIIDKWSYVQIWNIIVTMIMMIAKYGIQITVRRNSSLHCISSSIQLCKDGGMFIRMFMDRQGISALTMQWLYHRNAWINPGWKFFISSTVDFSNPKTVCYTKHMCQFNGVLFMEIYRDRCSLYKIRLITTLLFLLYLFALIYM